MAMIMASAAASLYVGDLQPDVNEGMLYDAFSEFKTISSVRVCRDASSGRSLCYGYVNFMSTQDAFHAIEVKNHSLLNGKPIRVMWSHRDPEIRKSGIGNVFVKNLSDSVDSVNLQDLFQKYGRILSCKVAASDDGKSKGFGFVQFDSEDSANAAIEQLNGSTVESKQIYVGKFIRKSDRVGHTPDVIYTNLYVKNLDPEVTEDGLHEKFSEFGKILSLVIARDGNGSSKGFGFVNYENPTDARQALEATNGSKFGSKILYVARAQKKAEREQLLRHQFEEKRRERIMKFQGSNVYVKNIDDNVTDDELKELFRQCGTVTSVKLMRDDKGLSRGFGFVCFSSPEEANHAMQTFHGFMLRRKPLYVAIAQRKEERQAQLQYQYAQHMAGFGGPSAFFGSSYPPLYYPAAGVLQVPTQPAVMYQPLSVRPGWRAHVYPNQTSTPSQRHNVSLISHNPRQNRQNRGRMNAHLLTQGGGQALSFVPHNQYANQSSTYIRDLGIQQRGQARYGSHGRLRENNRGSGASSASSLIAAGSGSQSPEALSSMLAAATPEDQKRMIGERLHPLVGQLEPDLVGRVTEMLLEMDNSELLLLLDSPESLAAKVEEAVQVLGHSDAIATSQNAFQPSFHSAGVAVN